MLSAKETTIGVQPLGGGGQFVAEGEMNVKVAGGVSVNVGVLVAVSDEVGSESKVGVKKANGEVGETKTGIGCVGGNADSAMASETPPMTKTIEMMAMMTPPPN